MAELTPEEIAWNEAHKDELDEILHNKPQPANVIQASSSDKRRFSAYISRNMRKLSKHYELNTPFSLNDAVSKTGISFEEMRDFLAYETAKAFGNRIEALGDDMFQFVNPFSSMHKMFESKP